MSGNHGYKWLKSKKTLCDLVFLAIIKIQYYLKENYWKDASWNYIRGSQGKYNY